MHQTFLSEVAAKLYNLYGAEISSLTLVFPSRRARLFFSDALSELIDKPIWQPHYISMDDVMCESSSLKVGEKILLITELYKIYTQHHPSETFDKFYFWGEMLLNDFDLIDKYMIDADMLFRNIYDLKELEADLSYLTPEMRQIINSFWSNFSDTEILSDEKRKFLAIWLSLAPIYNDFQKRMEEIGFAYAGKIYRSAVQNIESGAASPELSRHYIFIGFNALSECEKRVLKYLTNNGKCDFIWDYDDYYVLQHEQEAGRFLRENIKLFPPMMEIKHDNFVKIKKNVYAISTVTNVVQCKYVNTLLRKISPSLQFDKHTAIVLTDESLLMPLLHSLPEELQDNINVTMGYPLRQTTAYSFIERLIELQKNCHASEKVTSFYHSDVTGILAHPYIIEALGDKARSKYNDVIKGRLIRVDSSFFEGIKLLEVIFSATEGYSGLSKYLIDVIIAISETEQNNENRSLKLSYLTILAKNITELDNCLRKCAIEISTTTYVSLLRRHLQTVRIPFTGEPLEGLQVMGILETRNLDFDNVIILSMNDDNFPGSMTGASSFIPYNLRAAYGIPTPEHHEGVYAYYFYRLIQRAKHIDMLYCSHADEKSTGEQSRYIYQLDYESPYPPLRTNIGVDVAVMEKACNKIEKSGNVLRELERFTSDEKKMLSPSSFANYVACPMKFYFASVAKLKNPDELNENVDSSMFGTILHDAMEILYAPLVGIAHPAKHLQMIDSKSIEQAVIESINKNYLNKKSSKAEDFTGQLMLVKRIISKYISHSIIPYDIAHDSFALMHVEKDIDTLFEIDGGRTIRIGGRADRIDSLDNGMIRVVDYKTGEKHFNFASVESLFEGRTRSELKNLLQTITYSMVLRDSFGRNVQPALYFARYMHDKDYSPLLKTKGDSKNSQDVDYNMVATEFEEKLRLKLNELFDPSIPFERCPDEESNKICNYCDFKTLCKR